MRGIQRMMILHGLVLAVVNLLAIRVGVSWDKWTHLQHPFAAQLPVSTLLSVLVFALWHRISQRWNAGITGFGEGYAVYRVAILAGAAGFLLLEYLSDPPGVSLGRLMLFLSFQGTVNVLVLVFSNTDPVARAFVLLRSGLARPWVRKLLTAGSVLLITIVIIGMVEGGFYLLNQAGKKAPAKVYEGEYLEPGRFFQQDEKYGNSLKPDQRVSSILKVDGKLTWDVVYSTDAKGRRTTINPETGRRDRHALFFGCSFLFGEGANDEQTIPSRFAAAMPEYRAYNYGVPGYGTQQMLVHLQDPALTEEVPERQGMAFYLYLEDVHEGRVAGQMAVANRWGRNFPYFHLTTDDELVQEGNFSSGRPWLSLLYKLLGKSQTVKYLGLNLPNLEDAHYRLTARIIDESRKRYAQLFDSEDFYVILYPQKNAHRKIIPYLQEMGISYLDYADLFDTAASGNAFVGDGHPTPRANHLLVQQLVRDLP